MASYNSGPIVFKVTTEGLTQAAAAAQSVNKDMTAAAAAAGKLGKAAGGALKQSQTGLFAENREYGAARGVTGQTGASGRDFAKQAEGLGGLVRLYATFAANIFAVSMAFEALKRSFQFEQLQRASDAFAVTTGKNLSYVAQQMKELSQGSLTDKAAQSYANYGASAGFTADQMKRLVVVAKGASQALGRDMGDSIDRLIRGTGKLEPELLDELGLLTRTKAAGVEYGKAIGKTFEQLTQFEKTQAFVNAVLKEGEQKFGAVANAVDVSPFERLSTAVVNAGTAILNFLNKGIAPLAGFLAGNSGVLYAGITAAIMYLAKTALPMLGKASDEANLKAIESAQKQVAYHEAKRAQTELDIAETQKQATAEVAKYDKQIALYQKDAAAYQESINKKLAADTAFRKTSAQPGFSVSSTPVGKAANTTQYFEQLQNKYLAQSIALESVDAKRSAHAFALATKYEGLVKQAKEWALVEEKIKHEIEERNNDLGVALQAEERLVSLKKKSAIEAKAAVDIAKKSALSSIGPVTQMDGAGAGWIKAKEGLASIKDEAGKVGESFGKMSQAAYMGSALIKIGLNSVISVMGKLMNAFMYITIAITMFEGLVSITNGVNASFEKLAESQDVFAKVLNSSAGQIGQFGQLTKELDGSAEAFARLQSYSANVFTGISEGIADITKAFSAFAIDSGWWTTLKQKFMGLFDADAVTIQAEELRKGIITALSTTSPDDKAKVEKAILSAIPSAATIEQALSTIGSSSKLSLSFIGDKLSKSFADLNAEFKTQSSYLKQTQEAWKNFGTEVDKFSEKDSVKNPKLKGIVSSLEALYKTIESSKPEDLQKAFASVSEDNLNKLIELSKKYGLELSFVIQQIREAKIAEEERAVAIKKAQADAQTAALGRADYITATQKPSEGMAFQNVRKLFDEDSEALANAKTKSEGETALKDLKSRLEDAQKLKSEILSANGFKLDPEAKAAATSLIDGVLEMMRTRIVESQESFRETFKTTISGALNGFSLTGGLLASTPINTSSTKTVAPGGEAVMDPKWNQRDKDNLKGTEVKSKIDAELKAATAKMASMKAQSEQSAKISKEWEYQIQLIKSQLVVMKEIATIQQDLIGYTTADTQLKLTSLGYQLNAANYAKQQAELDNSDKKAKGDKAGAAQATLKANEQARIIASLQNDEANRAIALEQSKNALATEKVKLEQNYYYYLEESLKVQGLLVKAAKDYTLASSADSDIASANLVAARELLAIEKQRDIEALKIASIKELMKTADAQTASSLKVMLDSSQSALANQEKQRNLSAQRIEIERQLTVELAKQKQMWEQMAATAEALSSIVEFQLSTQSQIISYGQVSLANAQQEAILIMTSTKALREKLTLLGLSADSEEGQVIALAEQLKITQQIYDNRRKIWELASKDDSGADFGKTLAQGFQYAVEDFRKNMSSAITSIIGATMSGIDASIDYIIKNLKDGTQSTLKGMAKAFGQTAKDVLIQYIGDKVKLAMKQIIADMFEDKSNSLEEINKKVAASMDVASKTLTEVDNTNKQLISALQSLEKAIRDSASKGSEGTSVANSNLAGANEGAASSAVSLSDALTATSVNLDQSADSFDSLGYSAEVTGATMQVASGSMLGAANNLAKGVSGAIGSIKSLLGGLGVNIGGTAGAMLDGLSSMGSMFSSIASIGTNASGALGMLGSASSWAATGATSFATSLTGEMLGLSTAVEINAGAVTMMTTGIGDAMIGLAAAAPYIAAIVAAAYVAYKIFGAKKGGPKLEGFGGAQADENGVIQSANVIQSGDRGHKATNAGKEMAEDWSKGVLAGVKSFMDSAGRKMATGVGVGLGFEVDVAKDATGDSKGIGTVKKDGKVVYSSDEGGAPKGDEEGFQKWLADEAKRTMFAALKAQDDLPKNVAAYFETIAWDAIKTLSPEEIATKLDFASVLAYIDTNNSKLTKIFGESIYDITEEGLQSMQLQGEKYSETLGRLANTFEITNKFASVLGVGIDKAFDKVGLAGYEMRNKLIKAAGGLEAFTNKFNFYFENFYSESTRGAMAMSEAQSVVTSAFAEMGYAIPTTREGFNSLMTEFLGMGEAGQTLVAQLLEVAPAFDYIHDAIEGALGVIENALDSIQQKASDFRTQILDDTQSDEERWNRIKGQVDANVDVLDTISGMSADDLGALSVADIVKKTTDVQKNTEDAIGGVQKLWDTLSEDEKKIRGPEFLKWIDTIETNSATILARLGQAAVAKGGEVDANGVPVTKPKTPETTDELLAGLPESLATKLDASFITGADLMKTKMQEVFDAFAATFTGVMYNTGGTAPEGYSGTLPGAGEGGVEPDIAQTLQVADTIREQAKRDQVELLGQQQSILETLAAKLLDAAKSMNDAAAGQQSAAVDFKQAANAIPSKFEIKVEQESSADNSVGVK